MALEFFSELGKIKVLMLKGQKGDKGDDGTSGDYTGLTNKPTINGVTIDGALTSDDLGLSPITAVEDAETRLTSVETGLTEITSKTHWMFDVANYGFNLGSLSSGSLINVSKSVDVPTNMVVLGVVGFSADGQTGGGGSIPIDVLKIAKNSSDDTKIDIVVSNGGSSTINNVYVTFDVLFVREYFVN